LIELRAAKAQKRQNLERTLTVSRRFDVLTFRCFDVLTFSSCSLFAADRGRRDAVLVPLGRAAERVLSTYQPAAIFDVAAGLAVLGETAARGVDAHVE
jgi:hypothetical protein